MHQAAQTIREYNPAPLGTIDRQYRGDIETIVGKTLEKEKARRYASVSGLGGLNILVNNAAEQHVQPEGLAKITAKQLLDTFRTNIFSMFYLTKAALPYHKERATPWQWIYSPLRRLTDEERVDK